jgi:hypothetical protein
VKRRYAWAVFGRAGRRSDRRSEQGCERSAAEANDRSAAGRGATRESKKRATTRARRSPSVARAEERSGGVVLLKYKALFRHPATTGEAGNCSEASLAKRVTGAKRRDDFLQSERWRSESEAEA